MIKKAKSSKHETESCTSECDHSDLDDMTNEEDQENQENQGDQGDQEDQKNQEVQEDQEHEPGPKDKVVKEIKIPMEKDNSNKKIFSCCWCGKCKREVYFIL
jgi:hypothetical protein